MTSVKTSKVNINNVNGVHVSIEELIALKKLGQELDLSARKPSRAIISGATRTRYRGRGMEFAEVRPYQPGDDIRTIDWRVTARAQSPYTKLFQEERERPVFVVVDQRSSMFFGSTIQMKSVLAARIGSTIGWAANANNDRIGALVFGDQEQADIRPKGGKYGILELLNRIAHFNQILSSPVNTETHLSSHDMLAEARRIARPGSLIIIVSDFHDIIDETLEPLSMLARHSDICIFHTYDELERQLPQVGTLCVSNNERRMNVNFKAVENQFKQHFDQRRQMLLEHCTNTGVTLVSASTNQTVTDLLSPIFGKHKKKQRVRVPRND